MTFLTKKSINATRYAVVAQLVEQWTENPCVDSSILSDGKNQSLFIRDVIHVVFLYCFLRTTIYLYFLSKTPKIKTNVNGEKMNIALFHTVRDTDTAHTIGNMILEHACTVRYFEISRIWDKSCTKNPLIIFEGISHVIFLYSDEVAYHKTFIFFAGFCLGRGIRILAVEIAGKIQVPENCRHLGIILEPQSIEEYIQAEKIRFDVEDRKKRACTQLLEKGISCFDENMTFFISSGDTEVVKLFLEAGFDPNMTDTKGIPLLSIAVRAHFPEIVLLLLSSGADIDRQSNDRGYSPLMDAAQTKDIEMVTLLLEKGATPDLRSKDGQTALVITSGFGDVEMARVLVQYGADPTIADNLGLSAAGYANLFHNEELLALFNDHTA